MKNIKTFNQFINEDNSIDKVKHDIEMLKSKNEPSEDGHDTDFNLDNLRTTVEKGHDASQEDFEKSKNTISRKGALSIKQDDHVFHKHRQSLGIGNVKKLHDDGIHAIVHFTNGLQSSLVDEKGKHSHDEHKMNIKHLIAVAATEG